jgi:ATP-binding cassette, subfamily C, bacterial CydC
MSRRPGDLLSGLHHDIDTLQHVYLRIITPAIAAILFSLIAWAMLHLFDPILAWITLAFLLLHGLAVPALAVRLARGRGKTEVRTKAALTTYMVDQIQGLHETSWMGTAGQAETKYHNLQSVLDNDQKKNSGDGGLVEGLNNLLPHLGMLTILVVSIPLVMSGTLNTIIVAALAFGVLASFEAVQNLGSAFLQWESYREASHRLQEISASADSSSSPSTASHPLPEELQPITFREVAFSYEQEQITLKNISFTLMPGSRTAIVGPSGCGKSTLVNLVLGMYPADQGEIVYGQHPIHTYHPEQYKGLFGVVGQDGHIFNRSLRDNLLIAKPDADDDELRDGLMLSGLERLADQLDMEPGNLGMQLSGGERQRLLLARALLRSAPVWVFDEATAHLDIQSEQKILETINAVSGNRTLLMVTHRLIDMHTMDQILVMNRGEIAERGTHQSLLKAGGLYAALFQRQSELLRMKNEE